MQVIAQEYRDAEAYAQGALHRQVRAPLRCPRCGANGSLSVLGYYQRHVLILTRNEALPFAVRRFRCRECSVTVSMLLAFAQPYHLLGNEVLDEVVSGRAHPTRWKRRGLCPARQQNRRGPEWKDRPHARRQSPGAAGDHARCVEAVGRGEVRVMASGAGRC